MKYIINTLLAFTALPVFAHGEAAEKTAELGTAIGNMMGNSQSLFSTPHSMMGGVAPLTWLWTGGGMMQGWSVLLFIFTAIFWILVFVLLVAFIRWVWKKGS